MKSKAILIVVLQFVLAALLSAQTTVIDHKVIRGQERWSGTVLIKGDVVVGRGARLVIEPGTVVRFVANTDLARSGKDKTRAELIVKGSIFARGNIGRKITFTSASTNPRMQDWYGIQIMNLNNAAVFEYVIVEYAYNGIDIKKSDPTIKNCQIRFNYNAGVRVAVRSKARLIGNIIQDNGYAGVICETGAEPILTDNMITKNQIGIIAFGSARPHLGDLAASNSVNPGRNGLFDNYEYDLYNHSSNDLKAEGNSWGTQERDLIMKHIYDGQDASRYGLVDFNPIIGNIDLERKFLLAQTESQPPPEKVGQTTSETAQTTETALQPEMQPQTMDTTARLTAAEPPLQQQTTFSDTSAQQTFAPETTEQQTLTLNENLQPEENEPENKQPEMQIDYNQVFMDVFLDKKAKIIKKVPPVIDDPARGMYAHGKVIVRLIVGKDGRVEQAKILRGLNYYYDDLALKAARKFVYEPGTVKGVKVRFSTSVLFKF